MIKMIKMNKTQELYEYIIQNREQFFKFYNWVIKLNYTEEQLTESIQNIGFKGANYKEVAHQLINDFKQIR